MERWVEPKSPLVKPMSKDSQALTVSLTEAYLKPTIRDIDLSCKISQIRQLTQSSDEKQLSSQEQSPFVMNQKFFQQSIETNNNNNIKIIDRLEYPDQEQEQQQQPLQLNTDESIDVRTISDLENQMLIEDCQETQQAIKKQEQNQKRGMFLVNELTEELLIELCSEIYQQQKYPTLRSQVSVHNILKANRQHFQLLTPELIQNYLEVLGEQIINSDYVKSFLMQINLAYDHDMTQKLHLLSKRRFEPKEVTNQLVVPPIILTKEFLEEVCNRVEEINSPMLQITKMNQNLLFNCANEFLEYFRPFDLRGCPLSWKINLKKLTYSEINSQNIDIVLNQVFNKILSANYTQMGILPENSNDYFEDIQFVRKQKQEQQIQTDIEEEEEKWTTYDDEESIVTLEIADLIFNQLVSEMASEMLIKNEEKKNYSNTKNLVFLKK